MSSPLQLVPLIYTEGVNAHWTESQVGQDGELTLHNLPFAPGQAVEVLILPKPAPAASATVSLLGSVLEYQEPFEPVAADDWDSLR